MGVISVRDLRNDTGGVLRRVEAGETLIVHSNRRPVAQIVPLVERPTWLPAAQTAHPARVSRPRAPSLFMFRSALPQARCREGVRDFA